MTDKHEIKPGQSIELLKELHILTRDGKLNQDSRRKLKQVYHLYQFIEPLLDEIRQEHADIRLVDHGAGKSYLGFILYDLFFKALADASHIYGIETRDELVAQVARTGAAAGLSAHVLPQPVGRRLDRIGATAGADRHRHRAACLRHRDRRRDPFRAGKTGAASSCWCPAARPKWPPCCGRTRAETLAKNALTELWRHPMHTREFGSQLTNVLRCLQLEAHGYQVSVTELVGWEHSMKNELIIARYKDLPRRRPAERLQEVLRELGLEEMQERFFTESTDPAHSASCQH